MATIREIKGRITSTKSSEKITGAMKMISSAKLRRAEGALRMMNPYRNQLSSVISHLLSSDGDYPSPLTEVRSVSRMAFVVIGSEEGLCGAYNVYLFKKLLERIEYAKTTYGEDCKITIYPLGKKMTAILSKMQGVEVKKSEYLTAKSEFMFNFRKTARLFSKVVVPFCIPTRRRRWQPTPVLLPGKSHG